MPQLDKGFEIFVNWQTAVMCLGIFFITKIVRTFVEVAVPQVKAPSSKLYHLWNELFLPLGPFGTGILIALLAKKFPWPMPVAGAVSAKILYGMICGGMSGWFYGRVRAWAGVAADSESPKMQQIAAKLGVKPSNPPRAMTNSEITAEAEVIKHAEAKADIAEQEAKNVELTENAAKADAKVEDAAISVKFDDKPVK